MSDQNRIPQHVAIIMDGNGRWAELRGKERYEGHAAGIEPVRASLRAAVRNGVKYLTLYAFSTENWGRPQKEVDSLMELFCQSVISETPELVRQGVRVRMNGERSRFSEKDRSYLARAQEQTADGKAEDRRARRSRRDRPRRDRRTDRLRGPRHGRIPRSGPDRPHERRVPVEQLPAVAGLLRRALLSRGAVARFHRSGVRPRTGRVRPARPAVRTR